MPIDNQPIAGQQPGQDTGAPQVVTPPAPLKSPKKDKKDIKLERPGKNLKDIIDIRPQIKEASGKTAVFTFGRMNPPTAGHEKLINKVHSIARKHGATAHIVLSHSHDGKNNPIPQDKKIKYVQQIHRGVHVHGSSPDAPNFLSQAKKFHDSGHEHLVMVAGSDRVPEYEKILKKYNGHKDHFNFKSIKVVSAGQRDPDSEGTAGISGTKMRAFAKAGDHQSFKNGLPKSLQGQHKKIMSHIREYYENEDLLSATDQELEQELEQDYLTEEFVNERVMNLMQRRRAAIKMRRLKFRIQRMKKLKKKRMATTDMLVRRARRTARSWMRKRIAGSAGAKYAALSPSQKMQIDKRIEKKQAIIDKLAKRLLPKVKQQELIRLRKARGAVKESVNTNFEGYLATVQLARATDSLDRRQEEERLDSFKSFRTEASDPRREQLKQKQDSEGEDIKKRHAIEREKLTAQIAREKQGKIRREAREIAEAVDTMVDALAALDEKAQKANVPLDDLFVVFVEGYNEPHGQQTPQQGGFAAVNKMLAEMSAAEKDKAEDIVKGMKKKASYFRKKYGKDAKSVMYATANKMAQKEDYNELRRELTLEKGLWDNIHAKRKRIKDGSGEKMRAPGSKGAPTKQDFVRSQKDEESNAIAYVTGKVPAPTERNKKGFGLNVGKMARDQRRKEQINKMVSGRLGSIKVNEDARDVAYKRDGHDVQIKRHVGKDSAGRDSFSYSAHVGDTDLGTHTTQKKASSAVAKHLMKVGPKKINEAPDNRVAKMQQLFRMGLAKKGELQLMMRTLKGGEDALKNPKLREKVYELLDKLVDIVTSDGTIYVKVRQSVMKNREDLQAVEEMFDFGAMNIVGVNKAFENLNTMESCCEDCSSLDEELIEEDAVYIDEDGNKENVKLNNIQRGGSKKFYVYTKNDKGNVVKVSFGDPNLSIKRDDPERRKSFRARHNCDNPGPKWKARYWSCRQWRAGAKVED